MQQVFNYRLHGIELVEKYLHSAAITEETQFNFDIKAQSAIDNNRKLVVVAVEVKINKLYDEHVLAGFAIAFGFEIKEFETLLSLITQDTPAIPEELENPLKSIAVSTSRGIIFSELRGTHLHKAVMPVVAVDTFKQVEGSIFEELHQKKNK